MTILTTEVTETSAVQDFLESLTVQFTPPHLLLWLPLICSTMLSLPVLSELPTTPSSSSAEVTMSSDVLA